jgi:hypothetical protein
MAQATNHQPVTSLSLLLASRSAPPAPPALRPQPPQPAPPASSTTSAARRPQPTRSVAPAPSHQTRRSLPPGDRPTVAASLSRRDDSGRPPPPPLARCPSLHRVLCQRREVTRFACPFLSLSLRAGRNPSPPP